MKLSLTQQYTAVFQDLNPCCLVVVQAHHHLAYWDRLQKVFLPQEQDDPASYLQVSAAVCPLALKSYQVQIAQVHCYLVEESSWLQIGKLLPFQVSE